MQTAVVVEDIAETGTWLRQLLEEAFPGISVTVCREYQSAFVCLAEGGTELALVDISLPDGNGLDLIPVILQASPQAVVVVTTIMDDQEHILTALQAGASGYLLKDLPEEQFVRKLRGILLGDPPLSPKVARKVLQYFNGVGREAAVSKPVAESTPAPPDAEGLSSRETEVLVLIGKGLSRREVGALLHLSDNTIATHVRNVYRKLNISSRAEAALEACRLGLISTEL
ncbi:response regulator transcription factor [Candidatus Thiothrix sp. Deng01]|uniref:Response regulator transcription factor n=1 Tax=Candidatus Thiothrix phosphatis TaxID=3112415 RepID=A0ABU6CYN3_9GAMM|nr:response regulator transcription factor [Candidatus Thiothrix sp. Deng01]MEB4591939.1 response regulator transcription factor [Candidatus Thiothrix sp. Deng01]